MCSTNRLARLPQRRILDAMRTLGHFRFALVSAGLLKFADDELRRHALAQAICGV
jgi:hypothetical protein